MRIAHFNQCEADLRFERSQGALVYTDEKVVCIVITQSIKCFREEKNFRSIFLDEEKNILNFFSFLIS